MAYTPLFLAIIHEILLLLWKFWGICVLCVTRALWQSWKKHRNIKPFVKAKCVLTKNFFIHIKIQEIILLRIVMDYDSTCNTVLWLPYQVRRNSVCVPYEFFLVVNNGLWNTANHTIWRSRQQTALHSCKDSCTYKYTNSQWWRQLNQKFISMAKSRIQRSILKTGGATAP